MFQDLWKIDRRLIFCLGLLLVTVQGLYNFGLALEWAPRAALREGRGDAWLRTAQCAHNGGPILVYCDSPSGVLTAFPEQADDPGHALILSLLNHWNIRPPNQLTLVYINLGVNTLGIIILSWLWYSLGFPLAALLTLGLVSGFVYSNFNNADISGAYWGLYTCAMFLPIWLVAHWESDWRQPKVWHPLLLGVPLLAFTTLDRQTIGYTGIVCSVLAMGPILLRNPKTTGWRCYFLLCGLLLVILGCTMTTRTVYALRDAYYGTLPAMGSPYGHGFSQPLYIGLGTETNPWGISYIDGDQIAIAHVAEVDPSVPTLSAKFYDIILARYLDIVLQYPTEVGRIYLKKLYHILYYKMNLKIHGWHHQFSYPFLPILALLTGWHYWRYHRPGSTRSHIANRIALFMVIPYGSLYVQGILAAPLPEYMYPAILLLLMMFLLFLEDLLTNRGLLQGDQAG